MAAVRYRFRAELRTRWRSIVALALLAGAAGAVVIAAAAGARRTETAFGRMVHATRAADVLVNPDYGTGSGLDVQAVERLPMVEDGGKEQGVSVLPLPVHAADLEHGIGLAALGRFAYSFARPHLLHGRMPAADDAQAVLVNPEFARRYGVGVGDELEAVVATPSQLERFASSGGSVAEGLAQVNRGAVGTRVRLRVSGIGVTPDEVVVDEGFEQQALLTTPAFFHEYPQADAGFYGVAVRLRHGTADLAAFKRAVQALPHQGAIEFQTIDATSAKVERAVQPSVGALTIFAVAIALTALLVVGQTIARQSYLDSVDHAALRALGFERRQLVVVAMLRAVVAAIAAAALAVLGAVALSPLFPIGPARTAEPDPGLSVDAIVLVLGALAVVGAVVLLSAATAWWSTRIVPGGAEATIQPSLASRWLRRAGSPVVPSTGVRMALDPGRGRTAVPVRSTMLGAALAIASVVAAVTFAASLDHLVSTPRLYGWSWDVTVDSGGVAQQDATALVRQVSDQLARSPLVDGYSASAISRVDVDGTTVTVLGLAKGHQVGPTVVSGRTPRRDGEIALGQKTLDRIGASIGDTVRVHPDAGGAPVRLHVVGRVVLPGFGTYSGSDKTALGEGGVLIRAELRRLGPDFGPGPFLVRLAPGATRAQLTRALVPPSRRGEILVNDVQRPSDIVSYSRVRSTPLVLAGVLALLAIATVAHALVTAVRRRRRDVALLKTLGFTRRQVSASVAWQATTFGVVALVVGVPVGITLGRWAWTTLADDLGTVAEPIVPALALGLGVLLVLVVANLVAFVPGRIAADLRPAAVLRSE